MKYPATVDRCKHIYAITVIQSLHYLQTTLEFLFLFLLAHKSMCLSTTLYKGMYTVEKFKIENVHEQQLMI